MTPKTKFILTLLVAWAVWGVLGSILLLVPIIGWVIYPGGFVIIFIVISTIFRPGLKGETQ